MTLPLRLTAAALMPLVLTAGARVPKDPLAGRVAGPPVDCIDTQFADGPAIIDRHTIIYSTARTIYRTSPVAECPGLEPMATLIVIRYGGQLCRNDRFRALRMGERIPGPTCRFGAFVPYTKAPK